MAEMGAYTCNTLLSHSRGARPPSVNIGGATGPSGPPFPTPLAKNMFLYLLYTSSVSNPFVLVRNYPITAVERVWQRETNTFNMLEASVVLVFVMSAG